MPLTTRCRHCGRMFPVYAQQLKERRGKVDCPQCGGRFDGIGGLLEEPMPGMEMGRGDMGTGGSSQPAASTPAEMLDLSEGRRRRGRIRVTLWSLGVLALIAGLILQIGWWDRSKWLQHPQVRAAVEEVCARIGCRIELPGLAGTMEILQPALTELDDTPRGLRLTLALVNNAAVSQRLPQLQVELYDAQGKLAAARRFGPELYLPERDADGGLAPSEVVRPSLDLEDPPTPASGFRVKLF